MLKHLLHTCCLCLALLPALSRADGVFGIDMEIDPKVKAQREKQLASRAKQLDQQFEQQRLQRLAYLNMTIEQIDRTAELSEAQVTKLRIAAKGAVEKTLSEKQQAKFAEALESRSAYRRELIAKVIVAAVDERALLTSPQRIELTDTLAKDLDNPKVRRGCGGIIATLGHRAAQVAAHIDREIIDQVLDDSRMKAWGTKRLGRPLPSFTDELVRTK